MADQRVIVIVDALKGYLEEDNPLYCGDESRKIIPLIKNYVKREACPVLFICDSHSDNDPEFRLLGKHSMTGTKGAEIIPELEELGGISFEKETFSAWENPEFAQFMLEQVSPATTLIFMGVCTDICIFHNVAGAHFHGFEKLVVPSKCVSSFNQQNHEIALQWMNKQFGALIE